MSCDDISKTELPRLFESGSVTLSDEQETTVIDAVGLFSSADVWFSVPEDWQDNVAVRLYAKLATKRVLLAFVRLGDARGVVSLGNVSGIAISARGRPCTGLQVTVQRGPGSTLSDGVFAVQAWLANEAPEVLGGAPIGEYSISPVSNQSGISVAAGKVGDSGDPEERFAFLRVNSSGELAVNVQETVTVSRGAGTFEVEGTGTPGSPSGGVFTVQGPDAGVLEVSAVGTGTPGTPAGGVLSVQGPGSGGSLLVEGPESGGALKVTGADGGFLSVNGTRAPGDSTTNPVACVDAAAFNMAWTGSDWLRVGAAEAGDSMGNPTNCLKSAGYMLGWDGTNWKRVRLQATSSVSSISNASAPVGLAAAAFPYGYDSAGNQWVRMRCDSNGILYTLPIGGASLADNLNFAGNSVPTSWSLLAHRNQAGNWYLTRGGYNGVIAAAALPAIANNLAAGAYNTTAPAPSNGDGTALQVDGRGSLVVMQGRPDEDGRDTPSVYTGGGSAGGVIKSSRGNLLSVEAVHTHTGAAFFQLFDQNSAPGGSSTVLWSMKVAANTVYQVDRAMLSEAGMRFGSSGIAWGFSSARNSYSAIGTTADICVNATYV